MRRFALHLLLVAFLAVALAVGGGAVTDAAASPTTSEEPTAFMETFPVGSTTAPSDSTAAPSDSTAAPSDSTAAPSDSTTVSAADSMISPAMTPESGIRSVEFAPRAHTDIRIDLDPNRDADWTVTVRYELTDANETAAFETVSDRFLDGEIGPTVTRFENFAAGASENAGREMRIEDTERTVTVHDDPEAVDGMDVSDDAVAVAELRLTFTWTAFLAEDGANLVLGDALTTPTNGTWLRSLEDGQSIEVTTPSGYTVSGTPGATVPLRDNAVIIDGPRAFDEDERVAVVYSPTGTASAPPWTLLAGAIVLAALLIAGGLLGYRRFGSNGDGAAPGASGSSPTDAVETGDDGGAGAAVGGGPAPADEAEEDLSLLSDEERVERLLERNGGRMRQADIVDETGWSDAKVSQLLSRMADEGRVEKLRLGRENLISLPDGTDDVEESESEAGDAGSGTA